MIEEQSLDTLIKKQKKQKREDYRPPHKRNWNNRPRQ